MCYVFAIAFFLPASIPFPVYWPGQVVRDDDEAMIAHFQDLSDRFVTQRSLVNWKLLQVITSDAGANKNLELSDSQKKIVGAFR